MVNTGKPSSGCHPCRLRRLKCDDVRPTCLRCQKLRRTCHGYRDVTDLLFKDQTRKTIETVTKTLLKRSKPKHDLLGSPSNTLSHPLMDRSLCLFFADYIAIPFDKASPGYLDCLPSMYLESTSGSCLPKAVHAVALMHTYNLGSHFEVKCLAQQSYGDALISINEVLQDPVKRLTDDSILAIWLIGLYELIAGGLEWVIERSPTYASHMKGLTTLLHIRGEEQFRTSRSRTVFFAALGSAIIYALMAGHKSPVPDWQKPFARNADPVVWPGTRANSFHIQVADLCSEMKSLTPSMPERVDFYDDILRVKDAALLLQKSLLQWPCDGTKFQPRFVRNVRCSNERMEYFRDFHTYRHWAFFRGTMIVLHETLLQFDKRMKNLGPPHSSANVSFSVLSNAERALCANVIASMASQIQRTLPFVFGEVDSTGGVLASTDGRCWSERSRHAHLGGLTIWLLRIIKTSKYTTGAQKDKATEALEKIGRRMGVRQALVIADM